MPAILGIIAKIKRRSNALYIEVYFIALSNYRYYVYTNNSSWFPIPSYYLRIRIWISGSLSPLEKGYKKRSEVSL